MQVNKLLYKKMQMVVPMCAAIEAEIAQLDEEEKTEFLA